MATIERQERTELDGPIALAGVLDSAFELIALRTLLNAGTPTPDDPPTAAEEET